MSSSLCVLNDLHLGVERNAGTTPASQEALQVENQLAFANMLPDSDLMILGDLFDTQAVSERELLKTYISLDRWMLKGYKLVLVAGNHDKGKSSTTISSFDCLCTILTHHYPERVTVVSHGGRMTAYGYVIPHVANQDLFDYELSKVPDCEYLYLHCNYDNGFAAQSDQSLNLSMEAAAKCKASKIIIGHEHNARVIGKVYLPGCQLTTSVADWVHSGDKFYATVSKLGVQLHKFADRDVNFKAMNWKAAEPSDAKFIRLTGSATAEEAAAAVNLVSRYRARSDAYVVTNAIQLLSSEGVTLSIEESLESITAFDVKQELYKMLKASEIAKLEGLK